MKGQPVAEAPEPLVGVQEAAAFLGVSVRTLYLWAAHGRVPSYKVGALRRFRLSDLDALLRRRREGPRSASPSPSFRARRS